MIHADVVVIGAGISGAAAAFELAQSGLDVIILDRSGPAAMASGWTLAGVRQSGRHPAELPLATAAVALWQDLERRLDGPTHYRQRGNLRLARTPAEVVVIERLVQEQSAAGLPISLLHGAREIREVAPAIAETVLAASFCPSDGHADPVATVTSFVRAAERLGVRCRFGERVTALLMAGGRVTGVLTDKEEIAASHVVLAAGIFGNELLESVGLQVPLTVPMVTVLRSAPGPQVLEQVIGVANADCAGRQEVDGRWRVTSGLQPWHGQLRLGATPAVPPTAASVGEVVTRFAPLVPAFADALVEQVWAGLIDLTPDALPVIDAVAEPAGLTIAMGFSGHGFCLGPITGRIVAELVTEGRSSLPTQPFRLARFAGRAHEAATAMLHG